MAKLSEIIDVAKKLGIGIVENTEMSGFLVEKDGKFEKLGELELLKKCTWYTDEELDKLFGCSWVDGVKVSKPRVVHLNFKKDLFEPVVMKGEFAKKCMLNFSSPIIM